MIVGSTACDNSRYLHSTGEDIIRRDPASGALVEDTGSSV